MVLSGDLVWFSCLALSVVKEVINHLGHILTLERPKILSGSSVVRYLLKLDGLSRGDFFNFNFLQLATIFGKPWILGYSNQGYPLWLSLVGTQSPGGLHVTGHLSVLALWPLHAVNSCPCLGLQDSVQPAEVATRSFTVSSSTWVSNPQRVPLSA